MTSHCQFCKQPTTWIYRDSRKTDKDSNLICCCKSCAEIENQKKQAYLEISMILKTQPSESPDGHN